MGGEGRRIRPKRTAEVVGRPKKLSIHPLHRHLIQRQWTSAANVIKTPDGERSLTAPHKGDYPLHMACERRAPPSLILEILVGYPDAATLPGRLGWYPLHYAAQNRLSAEVLLALIKVYPPALDEMNEQQATPRYYRQTDAECRLILDKPTLCWIHQFQAEELAKKDEMKLVDMRDEKMKLKNELAAVRPRLDVLRNRVEALESLSLSTSAYIGKIRTLRDRMVDMERDGFIKILMFRGHVEQAQEVVGQELASMTPEERAEESRYQREYAEWALEECRKFEEGMKELKDAFDAAAAIVA